MKTKTLIILKRVLPGLVGIVALVAISSYASSSYRLNRRHEVPPPPELTISGDPDVLSRGGHGPKLTLCKRAIRHCGQC